MPQEYGPQLANLTCYVPGYGRILLYDDMEGVLKWGVVEGLPGYSTIKSQTGRYQGNYGIRISAYMTTPNGWSKQWAGRSVGLRGHKRIRASVVFRSFGGIIAKAFGWRVRYFDGTYRWTGSYEYVFQANDRGWHCLALEVDFHKGVYGRCWLDGVDLGMSGNALHSWATDQPEVLYVVASVASNQRRGMFANFDLVLVEEV